MLLIFVIEWPTRCPDLTNVALFKREKKIKNKLFNTITMGHHYNNERINKQNVP